MNLKENSNSTFRLDCQNVEGGFETDLSVAGKFHKSDIVYVLYITIIDLLFEAGFSKKQVGDFFSDLSGAGSKYYDSLEGK